MIIIWRRGGEGIPYNRPTTDFTLGVRGVGKSSYLEHRGEGFLERGQVVFDLFGSRDGEGLAWLRSPWANLDERTPDKEKKILLIHSETVDVEAPVKTITVPKLKINDFEKYDLLISSSPMYSTPGDEFNQVSVLTDLLYQRRVYKRICYTIVREASNLYYSRLRVNPNQTSAKAEMIYLIREARHMGIAMGLDTLKYTSIDLDIRAVVDYIIFKAQGILGFPKDLHFLYRYFKPSWVRNMSPGAFVILTRKGGIGVGLFPEVSWHKKPKEDIVKKVGITVTQGEAMEYSKELGDNYRTMGDPDHILMVELYTGSAAEDGKVIGINKIGKHPKIMRSASVVRRELLKHDKQVERTGYCVVCRRAGCKHHTEKVYRSR